jgi:cardiolipin synthase (CMP-forming)
MLNLPNFLTLIRILSIPLFLVYLSYHRYLEALIVFIIGGITDFFDGLAARWMNQQTALGAYLDPIADKLLVITSYIVLGLIDGIPVWLAITVISRDVLIMLGYAIIFFLIDERPEVRPTLIGKFSTLLQLFTLGVAIALLHDADLMHPLLRDLFIGATAVATVLSGLQYIYRGFLWLQNKAPSISRIG